MSNQCNLTQAARSQAGQFLNRRHFLRLTGTAAAGAVVHPRMARAVALEILVGGMVIAGAAFVGWKLGKLAKDKLWPAPPMPELTNAPPVCWPTNQPPAGRPSNNQLAERQLRPTASAASSAGGVVVDLQTDDLVCLHDISDGGLISPVDGSLVTRYGRLVFQESADLKTWADRVFECWYNGHWMVIRFGQQVEQLQFMREAMVYLNGSANTQGFWRAKA